MRYYLVAGETSGDVHGANLIKALKQEDAAAEFRFVGGDRMLAEAGAAALLKHHAEMAFMGFVEVIANLNTILANLKAVRSDVLAYRPDALILIDFPGFNLKVAAFAKKHGIRVFYYISPKIWAWNQRRVHTIKQVVDRMFCILPFEVDFYKRFGMEVDYVGNPILDAIAANQPSEQFKVENDLNVKPLIALLPGSRRQELTRILPEMVKVAHRFPDYQFVIAGAPGFSEEDYHTITGDRNIRIVFDQTYNLLLHAQAAIVTSGTATLETALLKIPQVVVYKGSPVSVAIARLLVKIRYISLVNLVMDDTVVKELIQEECNPQKIGDELDNLLHDTLYRTRMMINYDELAGRMGNAGASARTAKLMVDYLRK